MSRHEFLKTTAVAANAMGEATFPFGRLYAQGTAKYRRLNIFHPEAKRTIASYKKAIRAMLALPPNRST